MGQNFEYLGCLDQNAPWIQSVDDVRTSPENARTTHKQAWKLLLSLKCDAVSSCRKNLSPANSSTYAELCLLGRPGQWAIGFVNPYGLVLQALPTTKSLYQALIDGAADGSYRYPLGQENNIDPREHMPIGADQRIQVSREDHEIYMKMDSTFEVCKICHSGRKNLRMEPCQHLIVCFFDVFARAKSQLMCVFVFCFSVVNATIIGTLSSDEKVELR